MKKAVQVHGYVHTLQADVLIKVDFHCVVLASLSWQIHTGMWSLPH